MYGPRAKRPRVASDDDDDVDKDSVERSVSTPSPSRRLAGPNESDAGIAQSSPNEPSPNEEKDESNSLLANCRLRHGLNEDCLYEIFKFLNVYDLIQLCELDIYFQKLIVKWVIGKKVINFTKMEPCWTTNKIFEVFGKAMRKIKIAEENTLGSFERFLNFVIQHCSIDGLSDVELRFRTPVAPMAVMTQSFPYFCNIQKLILHDSYCRVSYEEFLLGISSVSTNLTHLTLEGVDVSGDWLTANGMDNLREFRIHTSKRSSLYVETTDLAIFLRTKSKLKLFSYIGSVDIKPVVDTLTEYCTQLKTFVDFHLKDTNSHTQTITEEIKNRYNYVRQFDAVTTVGLTSYTQCGSDIYYPLVKMAAQNKVETLKIYIDRDRAIILPESRRMHYSHTDFAHFTRLKSIELQIKCESSDQSELNAEFICEFISKLETVERFWVKCEPAVRDINKVIDLAPHLNELHIGQVKMKYLPVEMRKIVKSIRKRREQMVATGQANPPSFHLIVNEQQWREVQVYKDVDIIIITTVEYNDYGHTFKVLGA